MCAGIWALEGEGRFLRLNQDLRRASRITTCVRSPVPVALWPVGAVRRKLRDRQRPVQLPLQLRPRRATLCWRPAEGWTFTSPASPIASRSGRWTTRLPALDQFPEQFPEPERLQQRDRLPDLSRVGRGCASRGNHSSSARAGSACCYLCTALCGEAAGTLREPDLCRRSMAGTRTPGAKALTSVDPVRPD